MASWGYAKILNARGAFGAGYHDANSSSIASTRVRRVCLEQSDSFGLDAERRAVLVHSDLQGPHESTPGP